MHSGSSLSDAQRAAAVALFQEGLGCRAAATRLGLGKNAVELLYNRWRVRGEAALMSERRYRVYSFEVKMEAVRRSSAGESNVDLAIEFDVASPRTIQKWVRDFNRFGADALRPARGESARPAPQLSDTEKELKRLRAENVRLRAQVAYLGKVGALKARERT